MPHQDTAGSDASAHIADTSDAHDASAISVNSATLVGVGTDVQAVLEEMDDAIAAGGGAPAASAVTVDSTTLVGTGTNQQAVDEEFDNAIVAAQAAADNHIADASDAHDASAISIADAGSDFTATTVEGALDELQADNEAHLADTSTAHAAASVDAVQRFGGGREKYYAGGNTGATVTFDLANGNVQGFTVNANCVFTMPSGLTSAEANSFTVMLVDSGGPRTIAFTGVLWSGGANPTAMSGASAKDRFTFLTVDGGTTWEGYIAGTGMAT